MQAVSRRPWYFWLGVGWLTLVVVLGLAFVPGVTIAVLGLFATIVAACAIQVGLEP